MLEIFLVIFLCRKKGVDLRNKGWSNPIWMQIAVAAVWIDCELPVSLGNCLPPLALIGSANQRTS